MARLSCLIWACGLVLASLCQAQPTTQPDKHPVRPLVITPDGLRNGQVDIVPPDAIAPIPRSATTLPDSPMARLAATRPDYRTADGKINCAGCHGAASPAADSLPPRHRPLDQLAGIKPPVPTTRPDTTGALALTDRAPLRLKLGWYEKAEADFKELAKTEPGRVAAGLGLAELYRRTGRYDEADKALADIEPAAGKSSAWRCEKAELLAVRGKYEEALALTQAALAASKEDLRARWIAGQQLETLGRTKDAEELYKFADEFTSNTPPPDAAGKTYAGLILDRYSRLTASLKKYRTRILQNLYQDAYEVVDREYWPGRIASGDLLASAYKSDDAAKDYLQALKINPSAYHANLGLGRILLENWRFEDVDKQLEAAKKVNPRDPDVCQLEAALHMQERDFESAAKSAHAGLATNPRHIGCLGVLAAANLRQVHPDKVAELTKAAEAINPKPAEFYAILAEWQAAGRQFESAEGYFKKAVVLAPWDANPMTSLGMMYMQTGQEAEARTTLEAAFSVDAYNKRSKDTLDLLDQIQHFGVVQSEHFIIKFSNTTDSILGPYFRDYLEGIYAELTRDYAYQLPRKSTIEIFPSHEAFSVRVTGKSWIPTVGACTGWVVALYSPRDLVGKLDAQGNPRGFNWARVIRHEFTHVVTLGATENRIPHWFTEGLAVHQEMAPTSWRWVQMLSEATRRDILFPVDKLDWGFVRPKGRNDRELAYAQSEWMVQFILARKSADGKPGYSKILDLIKAFRDNKTQAQALADVLGVTEKQFDHQFREWARNVVANEWHMPADKILTADEAQKIAATQPADAKAQAKLATAYSFARKPKEAEAAARAALAIDPDQTAALALLGSLLEKAHWADAEPLLRHLYQLDPTNGTAPRLLGRHALAGGKFDEAIVWFNALKLANPADTLSYTGLAGIYLNQDNKELAVIELAELARREQGDPKYALKLASLYNQLGQPDQAIYWLTEAMHIDPFNAATHEQLAVSYLGTSKPEQAIEEMKVAIKLKPNDAGYWARLAFIYHSRKQTDLARKAAEFAVGINPASPARELLGQDAPALPTPGPQPVPAAGPGHDSGATSQPAEPKRGLFFD